MPEIAQAALAIAGAYLIGSIPSAYIAAKVMKGIDIREYGSGNVGAANLVAHIGKKVGLSIGAFDCLIKGTLPVVLARLLDLSPGIQIGVGLAAVAGHNWSVYIGFTGGRGLATAIGVILGFLMWRELLVLTVVMGLIGYLILQDTGFWTFVSALVLAPLAYLFQVYLDGGPVYTVYLSLGIVGLVFLKRVTANWIRPPKAYPLSKVMLYRLVFDRDVPRQATWIQREPIQGKDNDLPQTSGHRN